jgi:hypothetical protein
VTTTGAKALLMKAITPPIFSRDPEIAHSGPFGCDFFHHTQPVTPVTDTHFTLRNNEDLIGAARCVSVSQDVPNSIQRALTK